MKAKSPSLGLEVLTNESRHEIPHSKEASREREEQNEAQNIDVYEAIAGLYEEIAALTEANAALTERVTQLEGGQNK